MEKTKYILKWLNINKKTVSGTLIWFVTELFGLAGIFDKLQGLEYAQWLIAMISLLLINVLIVKGLFGVGLEDPEVVAFLREEVTKYINGLEEDVKDDTVSVDRVEVIE